MRRKRKKGPGLSFRNYGTPEYPSCDTSALLYCMCIIYQKSRNMFKMACFAGTPERDNKKHIRKDLYALRKIDVGAETTSNFS